MKHLKKTSKSHINIYLLYKIFSKCKIDGVLFIYGVFAYLVSGILCGMLFHNSGKHYVFYGIGVNFLPVIFLYFAKIFTKDKGKLKLNIFSMFWGVIAYIGTVLGEYFREIVNVMFMIVDKYSINDSFAGAKIYVDSILEQHTRFNGLIGEAISKFIFIDYEGTLHFLNLGDNSKYAAIYLELSRIFIIIFGAILVSDYFLSTKKYINFIGKDKSKNNIYYNNGLISTELPLTIRPKPVLYLLPMLILIPCSIYAVYSKGSLNVRSIYFLIGINITVYFIMLVVLEFNKVKFKLDMMQWHDNLNIKNTKLKYKDITFVDIETGIINTIYKQILIYSNGSKKPDKIQIKFLDKYRISQILRVIKEKAPDAQLSNTAEMLRREERIINKMLANWIVNLIVCFFVLNIPITIILTS